MCVPLSHNNIPHHRPNHGHTTKKKPRETGGGRQTWYGEGHRGERRKGRLEFKSSEYFLAFTYPNVLFLLPESCPAVLGTVFGLSERMTACNKASIILYFNRKDLITEEENSFCPFTLPHRQTQLLKERKTSQGNITLSPQSL